MKIPTMLLFFIPIFSFFIEQSFAALQQTKNFEVIKLEDFKISGARLSLELGFSHNTNKVKVWNLEQTSFEEKPLQIRPIIILFKDNNRGSFFLELSNILIKNDYYVISINNSLLTKYSKIEIIEPLIKKIKNSADNSFSESVKALENIPIISCAEPSSSSNLYFFSIYNIKSGKINHHELIIKFDSLKKVATLTLLDQKLTLTTVNEVIQQILHWCDLNMKNILDTVKTTNNFWQEPIFFKLPDKPWPIINFPFKDRHLTYCTQGNASNWPQSHFYFRVLFSLDLASDILNGPGEIYSGIDGIAYVKNNCEERINSFDSFNNSDCNDGFGNVVRVLSNNSDYYVLYAHLSEIYVKDGEKVKSGDLIGLEGLSGAAGRRHLHWGVYKIDNPIKLKKETAPGMPFPFIFEAKFHGAKKPKLLHSTEIKCLEEFGISTILMK